MTTLRALAVAALLVAAALGFSGWTAPDNILSFASGAWFCR